MRFILKQYHRNITGVSAGVLEHEWIIEAPTASAAVAIADKHLLTDFRLDEDFAVLWDDSGKIVWDRVSAV